MEKRLSFEEIRRFSQSFNMDPKNILALNAVTENGIAAVALWQFYRAKKVQRAWTVEGK